MFYVVCKDVDHRTGLIDALRQEGIHAVFHYLSLHKSPFYRNRHDGRALPNSDFFSDNLVRLPMYYELTADQVDHICSVILRYHHM